MIVGSVIGWENVCACLITPSYRWQTLAELPCQLVEKQRNSPSPPVLTSAGWLQPGLLRLILCQRPVGRKRSQPKHGEENSRQAHSSHLLITAPSCDTTTLRVSGKDIKVTRFVSTELSEVVSDGWAASLTLLDGVYMGDQCWRWNRPAFGNDDRVSDAWAGIPGDTTQPARPTNPRTTGTRRPAAAAATSAAIEGSISPRVRRKSPSRAASGSPLR